MSKSSVLASLFIFMFAISGAFAQKQRLKPEDFGQWQSITNTEFSADGNWFAYNIELVSEEKDGWLIIKKVGSDSTGTHKFMHGFDVAFTKNSTWAALLIGVSEEKQEKLKKKEKRVKYKLAIMNLATAEVDTFAHIQSFIFSPSSKYLVMKKYKPQKVKSKGTDIILRNLETGTNRLIGNVADYDFNDAGTMLAVRIDANEKLGNGVHLYNLAENSFNVLDADSTEYTNLIWHDEKNILAFMKARKKENYEDKTYLVYAFKNLGEEVDKYVFDQRDYKAFSDSMRIVTYRSLRWSKDGKSLFFGIKRWKKKEKPKKKKDKKEKHKKEANDGEEEKNKKNKTAETDTTTQGVTPQNTPDDDLPPSNVEIWHWQDARIQPKQEITYRSDLKSNFLAAWHINDRRFVKIGSDKYEKVDLMSDGEHAIAYDSTPYEPTFEEPWRDVYLIDADDGSTRMVLEKFENVRGSTDGAYLYYFKHHEWWTYDISSDEYVNLTKNIDAPFHRYHQVNGRKWKRAYGTGQWSKNDKWLLLYSEYDVYKVSPDGNKIKRLTSGADENIRYRQIVFNRDYNYLKSDKPLYFAMYGDSTKYHGFARLGQNELETLIYKPAMINRLMKAKSAKKFVYMEQGAANSPDFFFTGFFFDDRLALTNTNPQQKKYYWADDQLITFYNADGERLQGRLLYPANYQPGKKYPMITYIYEERSNRMHLYSRPAIDNPYNIRRYSSAGYFVFQPDITYDLHDPGMSAVESVVPAVKKVISTGMINPEQIGLTGHSWGAYQTTFIITQTDLFSSAVAGAPLTNMISMYNSIYWNAGITDGNIFEISQGRLPHPWWKHWDTYVQNSPIFQMEEVSTPLLVAFGTKDGAVDYNQGVELYTTMRRMQNPFVMLVYEGANHFPSEQENQIDYATRAFQWHQYYLLGKEPADWITEGLKYIERPAVQQKLKKGEIDV